MPLLKDYYDQGPLTPKKEDSGLLPMSNTENIDTQVMNIEADFEQLDIGEEPIFERNVIKQTSMNIFKDKMSHLQYCQPSKKAPSMLETNNRLAVAADRRQVRAKSNVQTFERSLLLIRDSNHADEERKDTIVQDLPQQQVQGRDSILTETGFGFGPISRFSNTVDFESSQSLQQFVPLSKKEKEQRRQTIGPKPVPAYKDEKEDE